MQGQPGAVYDIAALEDIVTPDGVVHAKAGELVATLTTGSDGTATSEPLYLGRYQVSERTAPTGMVLDSEPKEVTLAYAGQEVSVTTADVGFVNERQKVEISLKKLLEQDETFSIGMNGRTSLSACSPQRKLSPPMAVPSPPMASSRPPASMKTGTAPSKPTSPAGPRCM